MTLQVVDGKLVEVVEFNALPPLPIHGLTEAERVYETARSMANGYFSPRFDPTFPTTGRCAEALDDAIRSGIITEGGKYAIHIVPGEDRYEIYGVTD